MRQTLYIATVMGAMLLLAAGAAVAGPRVINGTQGDDTLRGTRSADTINGKGGADRIFGKVGRDEIDGGIGADKIDGGRGNDIINGGSGKDRITGGSGRDVIEGGPGGDRINVADGEFDSVSCGTGNDTVIVDEVDLGNQSFEDFVRLSSCEDVIVREP